LEWVSGKVNGECPRWRRAIEFRQFLETVDAATPTGLDVHLIVDNYDTHKVPLVQRWLSRHPRFHLHFVPAGFSWAHLVELWFFALEELQPSWGARRGVHHLKIALRHYADRHDQSSPPFSWTKSDEQIWQKEAKLPRAVADGGR
jgi:hypothetical protein